MAFAVTNFSGGMSASTPEVCGGISGGDINCQAAQDITTEMRSGVGTHCCCNLRTLLFGTYGLYGGFFLSNNGLNDGEGLDKFEITEYSSQVTHIVV